MVLEPLRFERLRRGWSCDRVAVELCGVAHARGEATPGVNGHMVNRWERGARRPSPHYVRLLCLLYEKPADELGLVVWTSDDRMLAPKAEALRVAIAVVMRGTHLLLVCRRAAAGGISWQFPAGVVKPGADAAAAAVQETLAETGVHCTVVRHLGNRLHPLTNVHCNYFLCEYLAGEAVNRDVVENVDVAWVERAHLARFIPRGTVFPPVLDLDPPIVRRWASLGIGRSRRGAAAQAVRRR
jgi:8-oxo-dGTP pyrophosphatase MutT (NUDIX family)